MMVNVIVLANLLLHLFSYVTEHDDVLEDYFLQSVWQTDQGMPMWCLCSVDWMDCLTPTRQILAR